MKHMRKLTPALLKKIIEEERQKLIKEGAIINHKPRKIKRKSSAKKKSKKNIESLKELALIEKKQRLAVKAFKILFERKKVLEKKIKRQ